MEASSTSIRNPKAEIPEDFDYEEAKAILEKRSQSVKIKENLDEVVDAGLHLDFLKFY